MTRPIKFRAWDKRKSRMLYLSDDFTPGNTPVVAQIFEDGWEFNEIGDDAKQRVACSQNENTGRDDGVLMQSTGLTDKNGKEIWEGDLMASYNGEFAGQVFYQAPSFIIKKNARAKTWFDFQLSPDQNQFYRVIGNRWENPELLEEK